MIRRCPQSPTNKLSSETKSVVGLRRSLDRLPPSGLTVRPEKSTMPAVSLGAARIAQRSPSSHAAPETSESCVVIVSPEVGSSSTGADGLGPPQARRSAVQRVVSRHSRGTGTPER